MKITLEKNLAFRDQPEPLLAGQIARRIRARKARRRLTSREIELSLFVPGGGSPKVEPLNEGAARNEVKLRVANFRLGEHVFPPEMEVRQIESLGNKSAKFRTPLESEASIPDHLGLRPVPKALPKSLEAPPFFQPCLQETARKFGNRATTVFAPENRLVFNDTSYPWSTCGRVDTPLGFASGVMVGPRHMLTVSHTIQWNANNTAGWVRFRPSFFNGSAPFGEAWGTLIYSKRKVTGPTIDWIEGMFDYVVVVLNTTMGNLTGWMGSRGYTDAWDGTGYWAHVGYPGDLTAGNRPTFENSISLDGVWWQLDSHEAMAHRGDVWPGQSGGPFFGWWSGEVGPRAVAVQSSQNNNENNASGGQDMVDLIIRARNEHP
jgi:V8-like Glu-specific endopeptidase